LTHSSQLHDIANGWDIRMDVMAERPMFPRVTLTKRLDPMKKTIIMLAAVALSVLSLSSCGNTIRGVGKDAANTVDATQNAGNRVDRAARR
jgi:entericidin B